MDSWGPASSLRPGTHLPQTRFPLTLASLSCGQNPVSAQAAPPLYVSNPQLAFLPICSPQQGTRDDVLGWRVVEDRLELQGAAGEPTGAVRQALAGTQGATGQSAPGGGSRGQRLQKVS